MANNRMMLGCPCGKDIVIARVGVGSPEWDALKTPESLTAWLREHEECEQHPRAFDYSAVGFTLGYEASASRPGGGPNGTEERPVFVDVPSLDQWGRKTLREKQDELSRQWREHFAAWEWATRSLAAKVNALPACRAPGTHAPDCECATL